MLTDERFEALAAKYIDMVYRVAFGALKNREDAEDVTQEVLIKLYREKRDFESPEHVKRWLIRVTVNQSRKLFRSPWRRAEPLEDYAERLGFEQPEDRGLFLAVMGLEAKYRLPVLLYYYEGYSTAETAELLGLPPNTVSTRPRPGEGAAEGDFVGGGLTWTNTRRKSASAGPFRPCAPPAAF